MGTETIVVVVVWDPLCDGVVLGRVETTVILGVFRTVAYAVETAGGEQSSQHCLLPGDLSPKGAFLKNQKNPLGEHQ
jgi:hypothetical protein